MQTPIFRREICPGLIELTLNDPDRLNAMTEEMGNAIADHVALFKADPTLRCVIVRGAGRAFSSGGNLQFIKDNCARSKEENERVMVAFYTKFLSLAEIPVPTLALIHGPAVGAGLAIALACDVRFATDDAKLGVNFTKIGLTPGMGSTFFLPRVVGRARALELFSSGRLVSGIEAKAIGLVHDCFSSIEARDDAGLAWAKAVLANAPLALRGTKHLLTRDLEGLSHALHLEAKEQAIVFASDDIREGVLSIEQKRQPVFVGR